LSFYVHILSKGDKSQQSVLGRGSFEQLVMSNLQKAEGRRQNAEGKIVNLEIKTIVSVLWNLQPDNLYPIILPNFI